MFETFHQSPHGDFKPTFYNPFEIKHRRRTTKAQYRVLEEAYQENNKPSASARKQIAARLGMTARAVQVWFQNRRAKDKSGGTGGHGKELAAINSSSSGSGSCAIERETGMMALSEELDEPRQFATDRGRKRLGSASAESLTGSSVSLFGPSSTGGMARRHSMPDMNPLAKAGQLPFKELHEAIFGKQQGASQNPTTYYHAISRPLLAPAPIPIAPFPTHGQAISHHGQHHSQHHHVPILPSSPSASALEMAMAAGLGQSDALRPLLKKNPAIANLFAYYLNAGQLAGPVAGDGSSEQLSAGNVDETGGVDPMSLLGGGGPPPPDGSGYQSPLLSHDPMISGESGNNSRKLIQRHTVSAATVALPVQDMTAPSISAPESSPTLSSEDIYQQLRDLMQLGQQPPNALLIESVANDLAHHFSPAQLGVLLEEECPTGGTASAGGKSPTGCGKLDNMDLFAHANDFGADAIFAAGDQFYNFPPEYDSADAMSTGRF